MTKNVHLHLYYAYYVLEKVVTHSLQLSVMMLNLFFPFKVKRMFHSHCGKLVFKLQRSSCSTCQGILASLFCCKLCDLVAQYKSQLAVAAFLKNMSRKFRVLQARQYKKHIYIYIAKKKCMALNYSIHILVYDNHLFT